MKLIIKKFSMNRGAPTWFRMFGAIMWNLLIIKPFFHWIFWKTKIQNYIGIWAFLVLLESPHQVWFNKVYFLILRPKMWTILLNFWWVLLLEIQKNCKKGFGRKIQLNAFKFRHRVHLCLISFYHNFKHILRYHVYKNE